MQLRLTSGSFGVRKILGTVRNTMSACRLLWPLYLAVYTVDHAPQRERLRGNQLHTFSDITSSSFETYVVKNI